MSEENTVDTNIEESKKPKKDTSKKDLPQDDFLKNFNWHQYQEGIDELDQKQISEFEKLVEKNFVDTSDENIIEGEVIHLTEKDVIIVEDIVDSGLTVESISQDILKSNPRSLEIATLLFKPKAYKKEIRIKYPAIEVGNEFLVGFGLDYNGLGRNLKEIYIIE